MVKYLAYSPKLEDQTEPPQGVEEHVVERVRELGLEMPPVREGWFSGNAAGGEFCAKPFPGGRPIWYWEVL